MAHRCGSSQSLRRLSLVSLLAPRLSHLANQPSIGRDLQQRTMSSFNLKDTDVAVTLPDGLSQDQVLSFHPFKTWIKTLNRSLDLQAKNKSHPFHSDPYRLRSISIQSYDRFGERLGFLKLTADVTNGGGEHLPGAVFLRGPAVAMLVILVPDDAPADTDERYALLTVQPRIAAGSLAFTELPAGMVDDEGEFVGTAAREIKEELGLDIPASELTCMSELAGVTSAKDAEEEGLPQAMFPSAGGCDEYVPIYLHQKTVPRAQLAEWTGRLTGLREHGEKITLKLVRMQDLWKEGARDAKCLAAVTLWEALKREGKV